MSDAATLTKKDFQTDQDVRWCPGCGDYAILSAVQSVFPELGIPRERFVVVSGIGCSSRFPYYMNTFGFHTIHGRAPAIATGLKLARPDLDVWIATGDGDALSIGGNHLIHALRRNVGVKILMFNNRIYGLTKGQYSPTSEYGKRTKSSPVGSVDYPFNAISVAIGAGATFVARSIDVFQAHLKETLRAAAAHPGTAFVEIYQNCNIFNDRAFADLTEKDVRDDALVHLETGQPLVFGKEKDRGVRLRGTELEVVRFADGFGPDDCLVWDETRSNPAIAFMVAQMAAPECPTPIGVLRRVEKGTFEAGMVGQIERETSRRGVGNLEQLLHSGELWTVHEDGSVSLTSEPAPATHVAPELALGPRRRGGGFEFALHAVARRGVRIDCYEIGASEPLRSLELEPDDRAPEPFRVWRGADSDLPESFEYVVRVDEGPPLLDPYAPNLSGGEVWGRCDDALAPGVGRRYRGLVGPESAAAIAAARPTIAAAERVIYELHVRGFTRHPSSDVEHPGSYAGVVEKLPYLKELGVTSIELLPVAEFDETENPRRDPGTGERLLNFWGYSPVSFFAPKAGYAVSREPGAAEAELRELVAACHRAGLEVILDVVFNHTAEGGGVAGDPLHALRGLDPAAYYLRAPATGAALDVTGCGNTVHCNHPVTSRLIVDALRSWVRRFGVDGFRFDLAAVFYRGHRGETLERSPIAEAIAADEELAGRLLIAEPWDATGFRPAAGFPAPWLEWDGEFRDSVRRFVGRLDPAAAPLVRGLSGGGPDAGRKPASRAIRFAACHDGRPLADVVAYREKHNRANGEGNRDGWDGEVAWHGGVEGATDAPALAARRDREVRALFALVAAAPGTAQLTAGDERGRTQRGNTNAWCRDDEIGWVHWTPHEEAEARRAFVAEALATRRRLGLGAIPAATARIAPFEAAEDLAFFETGAFALLRRERGGARRVVAANATAHDVEIPLPAATAGASWRIELATERGVAFDPSGSSLALPAGCVALLADGGVSLEAVPEELSGDRAGAAP